jgi:hypothetical protein
MQEEDFSLLLEEETEEKPDVPLTWLQPGRVVTPTRLLAANVSLDDLVILPFHLVIACVREEDTLAPFHVDALRRFERVFSTVQLLFSPWLAQMTPQLCRSCGLTMDRLLADGLKREHVKALNLGAADWASLFGMEEAHVAALGIRNPHRYFADAGGEWTSVPVCI